MMIDAEVAQAFEDAFKPLRDAAAAYVGAVGPVFADYHRRAVAAGVAFIAVLDEQCRAALDTEGDRT